MKKAMLLFFVLLPLLLCACDTISYRQMVEDSPQSQKCTYWCNEERSVFFFVNSENNAFGIIKTDSDTVDVYFSFIERISLLRVFPKDSFNENTGVTDTARELECWKITISSDNEFTATVSKSTFFAEEDVFTFHKITLNEYEESTITKEDKGTELFP